MRIGLLLLSIAAAIGLTAWISFEWRLGNDRFARPRRINSAQNFFPGNADQDRSVREAFTAVDAAIDKTYRKSGSEFLWGKVFGWSTGALTVVLTFYASWRAQGNADSNLLAPSSIGAPNPPAALGNTLQVPPAQGGRRTYLVIAAIALIGSLTNFGSMALKAEAQDQVARAEWMETKLAALKKQAADPSADFDGILSEAKRLPIVPVERKGQQP